MIEAIVQGVCRSSRELLVSADDVRESGREISLSLAESAKLAKLKTGQVLKLGAEIGDGAALTVTTIAGDEGRKGAEDPTWSSRASSRAPAAAEPAGRPSRAYSSVV